ncbi:MAG: phosphatidate cytidylyltransferase [Spirochaetota bacterium]|nr:phosphatidate cytidylyltransferase [Spirochaetota bacterium]
MSDVKKSTILRVISASVGLPLYVFAITTDRLLSIPVLIASMIITLISLNEYYIMCERDEGKPFRLVGLLTGASVNIIIYLFAFGEHWGFHEIFNSIDARVIIALFVLFISIILIIQLFKRPINGGIYSLSVTVFGVVFFVLSFSHIILMKALEHGLYYILILNIVVMLNDTGAYFGGVLLGRHKTNFKVSPNKTWEGYLSGFFISIIAIVITNEVIKSFFCISLFTMFEAVILGIFISILGHIGDLVESVIKRDSAKKDSGTIIPGHGGMLDVFDALIFTFPFFYYYLILKGVS